MEFEKADIMLHRVKSLDHSVVTVWDGDLFLDHLILANLASTHDVRAANCIQTVYSNESCIAEKFIQQTNPHNDIIAHQLSTLCDLNVPKIINGKFSCKGHMLTNLYGGPEIVNGDYTISSNPMRDVDGIAEVIIGNFWLLGSNCRDEQRNGVPEFHFSDIHRRLKRLTGNILINPALCRSMTDILDLMLIERWDGILKFVTIGSIDETVVGLYEEAEQVAEVINVNRADGRIGIMRAKRALDALTEKFNHVTYWKSHE